jgi:hypothetical protein
LVVDLPVTQLALPLGYSVGTSWPLPDLGNVAELAWTNAVGRKRLLRKFDFHWDIVAFRYLADRYPLALARAVRNQQDTNPAVIQKGPWALDFGGLQSRGSVPCTV